MKNLWSVDPSHSEITFKVKHMMIAKVTGIMTDYAVDVETDGDDFTTAKVKFTGKTASISTGNDQRDAHLASSEFFDVEKFPEITFVSTGHEKLDYGNFRVNGNLTIRGITKPVSLNVEFGVIQNDPWGNTKAGFSVTGNINRSDFGLTWNTILEKGGVMVSEDVKVACEIELLKS
jgi:polyisoprenoid-binding protein YceI